jgi:hypothetical protein
MSGSRDDWLPATASAVLALARTRRAEADRAEADLLQLAVQWAVIHPAESVEEAETIRLRSFGDTGIPVAGPGAPLVAEFSIAEFATAIGLSTEAGKRYVGHAVELRYRLPRIWKRVVSADLPAWKARRIADQTTHLSPDAAKYVDQHLAPVAHKVKPAQLDRLLAEALTRYMPEEAEQRRRDSWDQRHFDIDFAATDIAGTCPVTGEIDLADAIDLNAAVVAEANRQGDLGSTLTLDQRRAVALGVIARRDLTLDYPRDETPPAPNTATRRQTVLHLHLSETAIRGTGTGEVGRIENTRTPVTAETIREWVGRPDLHLVVQPVKDLAEHVSVDAYEVPDRIAEAVALRDLTCVFPWCTRPARRLLPDEHGADCDHRHPHAQGGATCSCNIAPLCRPHHRLKTHGGWTYRIIEPGTYLWHSPHGYQHLRDHTGTLDTSHDKHRCRPADPPQERPAET